MSVAVVTGAARGIGRAIAERMAADQHELLLVDRDAAVAQVAGDLGGAAVEADLTTEEGRQGVLGAVSAAGGIGALVNNAGITRDGLVEDMTADQFREVVSVNLGAAYQLTEQLLPSIEPGGSVVSMSSRSYLGNVGQCNYATAKGGLVGMTRALAMRHAPDIRFNAVAPGFIDTEMTAAVPERIRQRIVSGIPMGRAGLPDEVAEAVSWLAGPRSSYVTGQVVFVCGGRSIG